MTRLIFICIFSFFLSSYCYGQNFKAGLIAGVSTSQVSGDQLGGFNKLGLKLGGSVNHFINSAPTIGEDGWFYRGGSSNSWFAVGRNLVASNNAIGMHCSIS